jgi:hypothetical protein
MRIPLQINFSINHFPSVIRICALLLWCQCLLLPTSCGVYSFTGVNIDKRIKTIAVANFFNNSGNGPANITQTLTEKVKDYYQSNSPLKITQGEGDLMLEGSIVGYDLTPIAPTADQQAALNRLTIRVQVKYVNTFDDSQNFDTAFSAYQDFPQAQTLSQVENELINTIFDRIVYDVFNKSVANW